MKILMLNWRDIKNPKSGGAEIVTMEYLKQWVKHGHKVLWFTSSFENASPEEVQEGIEVIRRGNSFTVYFFAFIFYFFSGIKFDLVIDQFHGIPFFTPLYVKVPIIAYIHEVAGEIWNYMYPFPINVIGRFLETFYLPLYKNIYFWTDSESTIGDLKTHGISEKNCIVITCGLNNAVLAKLPKKEKHVTFIFVSRVVKMKGIEEVLKAFVLIRKEDSNANLWIVGTGDKEYIKELKELTKNYQIDKNIFFFGKVNEREKLKLMSRAHLLLHASVKEGCGLVVVEAGSQGTPSVVYNVGGLRNSVKNNNTGIVLQHNTPYEMAKEAMQLLSNKNRYKKFQLNGFKWTKSLQWGKAGNESLKMLEKVSIQ